MAVGCSDKLDLLVLTFFVEEGLNAAKVATLVLFGTEYSSLHADEIIKSLGSDRRLVLCTEDEMFNESLPNLAATHKLLPSKCMSNSRLWFPHTDMSISGCPSTRHRRRVLLEQYPSKGSPLPLDAR